VNGHWTRRFTGAGIIFLSFAFNATPAAAADTLTASPNPVSFGNVLVGSSSTINVTVSSDVSNATISPNLIVGASSFSVDGPCRTNAGGECTIGVSFRPTTIGAKQGTLRLTSDAGGSFDVALDGTGVAPIVDLSTQSLAFGNQHVGTQSPGQVVVVSNHGNSNASVFLGKSGTGASAFPTSPTPTNACGASPFTLTPNTSCQVSVAFAPTSSGATTASLDFSSNDPVNPSKSVNLSGTGTSPTVNISGGPLAFGDQNAGTQSAPMVVTVSNDASANEAATVSAALGGANAGDFAITSNGCTLAVAPGGSCQVSVAFGPAAAGAKSASLNFTTNDPANPAPSVALSGAGQNPVVAQDPIVSIPASPLDFGTQEAGTQSPVKVVTVSNDAAATGVATVSAALGGPNAGDFAITANGCAAPLSPGQSCDVAVAFAPGSPGDKSASLDFTTNDPSGPSRSIGLSGTGTDGSSPADTLPPETTITKMPRRKTTKRRATFAFRADEDGSTFECSLDRHAFAPCTSPASFHVKRGKHSLEVRATDSAGNTDPTPAKARWRVRKGS
jgi:hypothetical protein